MRSPLVPTLLALASLVPAAEIGWAGEPGDKAPAGWSVAAAASDAKVRWLAGELLVQAPPGRRALAACALSVADATDELPLRISALVAADGQRPLDDHPAILGLEWAGGASFAVGLGDDPRDRNEQRRGWAMWSAGGKATTVQAESQLFGGASPAHLRLVVSAREVAAWASRDGWAWQRIAGVDRAVLGAQGAPVRLVLGRGRVSERPGFDADPPGDPKGKTVNSYRFSGLRVEQDAADLPASLIRTYAKAESLEDTREAIAAAGRISAWKVQGPLPWNRENLPTQLPADFANQGEWKEHRSEDRILQLSRLLPGGGESETLLFWTMGTVELPADGPLRLLFDGMRETRLYVDGRLVANGDPERAEAEPDRQAVTVPLRAGRHEIALAVRSRRGAAAACLRTENGDPRWRIALLRRLAIDFPDDGELAQAAPFEIARLWEGLGFARAAAESLAETAKRESGETSERALVERARIFRNLRDEAAAAAEIAELTRRWGDGEDKLPAYVRAAQLWQRLDVPERALGALEEALKLPDLPAETRLQLRIERARLFLRQGEALASGGELRAAADVLPAEDPRRFALSIAAVHREVAVGKGVAQRLAELAKQAGSAAQVRLLAGVHGARNDEEGRLAARRAGAKLPADALDVLAIDLAEGLLAAKDEAGAVASYRQAVVQLGGTDPGDAKLPALRAAAVRAALASVPAGKAMFATAENGRSFQPQLRWKMAGPVNNQRWRAWSKDLVDPAQVDLGRPVEKCAWADPAPELVNGDSISLNVPGDTVTYFYAEFDSAEERQAVLSCGADDALTLWFNGRRMYQDRDQRGLAPDSILVPVPVAKGRNRILAAVQNGAGTSGFQCRFRAEPWPAAEMGAALRLLASAPEARPRAGQALVQLAENCLTAEMRDEAEALLRAAVRCWPDDPGLQMRALRPVLWEQRLVGSPELVRDAVVWAERLSADRAVTDLGLCRGLRQLAVDRLLDAGSFAAALARLRADALLELDALELARLLIREGDLWRRVGYPRLALAAWARARIQASTDGALQAEIDRRQWELRQIRGDTTVPNTPFEVGQLMRGIDRLAEAGDFERAAADLQKLLEIGRDQPALLAGGRIRGAGTWAAGRLRSLGGKVLEAWRDRWDSRAGDLLAKAGDDPARLEELLGRFPTGPAAVQALLRLGDIYASRGWWELCLGSANRVLAELPNGAPARPRALLRAAHAAARLGDRARLADPLLELEKLGKPVPWDGGEIAAKDLAAALARTMPAPRAAATPKALALDVGFEAGAPIGSLRADGGLGAHHEHGAVLADGLLLVAGPGDLLAVDAADGRLRWRAQRSGLSRGGGGIPTWALHSAMPAVAGGRAFARIQRGGWVLDAYALADGRRIWSSEDLPELQGLAPASLPAAVDGRVYALFANANTCLAVAIDAAEGTLLWSTAIGAGLPRQPISDGVEMLLSGNAPAPCLSGRDLFVCTDAGLAAALDAGTGALQWLHAYPRTAISPHEQTTLQRLLARGAGVVAADARRVYIHPRDSLGLFALDRGNGAQAWAQELTEARQLAAAVRVGSGTALLLQGADVRCLDAATGALRWRWLPGADAGPALGALATGGDAAWVGTRSGLVRLSLADGAAQPAAGWSSLGVADALPVISLADDALVACGDGRVAVLRVEGKAVRSRVPDALQPGPLPATGAKPAPAGVKDASPATAWFLPLSGGVQAIQRPSDAKDGEAYAVADGRLLRLDASAGRLVWQAPCPELRDLQFSADAIAVVSTPAVTVFDRATGARRWTALTDNWLPRLIRDPGSSARTSFSAAGAVSYWFGDWWFSIRDAKDGRQLGRGRATGPVAGGSVQDGRLHLVTWGDGQVKVELRNLQTGFLEETIPLEIGVQHGVGAAVLDDGTILAASEGGCAIWHPAARKRQGLDLKLHGIWAVWEDGERLSILGNHQHKVMGIVVDRGTGKVLVADEMWHWGRDWNERLSWIPRSCGDLVVRAFENRDGKSGMLGRDAAGKERWFWGNSPPHIRRILSGVPLGDRSLWLSHIADGRQLATVLDAAGQPVGEAPIVGALQGALVQPVAAGGVAVYAAANGIGGLLPAATAPVVDSGAAAPAREIAALAHQLRSPAVPIPRLDARPVVDAQADDWEGEPVIEIGAATGWREIDPGAVPPAAPLRLRLGWLDAGLGVHAHAPAGTARIVLAFHLPDWNFNSWPVPMTLAFAAEDGRPGQRILTGSFSDKPEARPEWRLAQAPDGLRLEYFLPWAALRRPNANEPSRIGISAEYVDAAGRRGCLEWGDGLSRGIQRESLMLVTLAGAPEKKAKKPKPEPKKDAKK